MASIDFDALRRAPVGGSGGVSETVAVNHRALITRTLSKYPVDHALFRELIQNSADAGATTVKVEFFTDGSKGPIKMDRIVDVQKQTVKRLRISNDGMNFRPEDWDRLREIAKGNPDETKIGAFGVGFYSVFAVTDEPMVLSGATGMNFYYKGDQLHYRRFEISEEMQKQATRKWTSIDLPYSSAKPLPELPHFTSFLAQSLTFVKLQQIEFTVDGIPLLVIQKVKSDPAKLDIPKEINLKSLDRSMQMDRVETESVQIKARYLNVTQLGKSEVESKGIVSFGLKFIHAFTADAEKPTEYTEAVLFLRNITGYISTYPSSAFAKKLQGAIMKPPPRHASISMIALSKAEADSSQLKSGIASQIFPKEFEDAKVFIGFPTKQTTALKSHIATPQAIPTMERAAVDTANAYVKDWNKEMMYMAGILTRIVYGTEMSSIGSLVSSGDAKKPVLNPEIFDKAGFIMSQFYFGSSTPDARIGQYIATGFWKSAKSVPLVTTKGVKPSTEARAMEDITFLKNVAMIPKEMYEGAPKFHDQVKTLGLIRTVDASDIQTEFRNRALDSADMIAFLKWAIKKVKNSEMSMAELGTMLGYALLADEKMGTIDMRSLMYYHNTSIIPAKMPVPYTCLPYTVAKEFRNADLEMIGWKPLDIYSWVMHLTGTYSGSLPIEQNLSVSPDFAQEVLSTISKQWYPQVTSVKTAIFELLRELTCIPTQKGMKKPSESYLHDIKMFPDLPIVSEAVKNSVSEELLVYLGVRKTIELKYVMERLHSDTKAGKWSSQDMVVYLASQQKDMQSTDFTFLKENEIVSSENDDRLHRVSELYQPADELREMGLPLLKWSDMNWNPRSSEALFLFKLGLKSHPPVQTVIELAAKAKTEEERDTALLYFIRYFDQNKYRSVYNSNIHEQFLPATIGSGEKIKKVTVAPRECFSSSSVALFGFPVLREDLQAEAWKFGVQIYPPIGDVVSRLVAVPPSSLEQANKMFTFMAGNISDLRNSDVNLLNSSAFIPIFDENTGNVSSYAPPSRVFIESSTTSSSGGGSKDLFYRSFFNFVSFDVGANAFLRYCGARDKPSMLELARLTVAEPNAMFVNAGGYAKYNELLVNFERNWAQLAGDAKLLADMKLSAFVVGRKFSVPGGEKSVAAAAAAGDGESDFDEDDSLADEDVEYVLARASEIVINDDVVNYNFFKMEILSAPFEPEIEKLYQRIGSLKMSNVVQESISLGASINSSDVSNVRKRILERTKLYLDLNDRIENTKVPFPHFEKNLRISSVSRIQIQRSIIRLALRRRQEPVITSTTASMTKRPDGGWTMYLVPKFEYFDVAQALVKVLLERPTPDAATVLESLMNSSLSSLERRGYNVKRLIKHQRQENEAAKAAHNKLLEEARQKEVERKKAEEAELESLKQKLMASGPLQGEPAPSSSDKELDLPPSYGSSSGKNTDSQLTRSQPQQPQKQDKSFDLGGVFNKLKRGSSRRSSASLPSSPREQRPLIEGTSAPRQQSPTRVPGGWDDDVPPPQQQQQQRPQRITSGSSTGSAPLTDSATRQLLQEGIQHTAAYRGENLQNDEQQWMPGQDVAASAAASAEQMCDRTVAHDLEFSGMVSNIGPKLYVSRGVPDRQVPRELQGHMKLFGHTLRELAVNVFKVRWDAIHMYYDENGESVAFNMNGSLFFNLRYFVRDVRATQTLASAGGFNMAKALDYWFPVMAHELAHNLEHSHGQRHSFFAETYIQQFAAAYRRVAKKHDSSV
ncbi:hypothetical protein BZA70DRAFT_273015 [Myxozyma melibiosi]|uniref:Sacsin/Nov domain-containing protein n=1 Tax=Myxozyma melibiosi TaxID=54550 RepID=A0ABR1FE91_9ASCO